MNSWLWMATVLAALLVPLMAVAVRARLLEGVVAMEVGGSMSAIALLLIAEGTNRQPFADLALALALLSFASSLAFLRFLERAR
jgi:multisubunit Na+/H+ antiporter MnhF subunit